MATLVFSTTACLDKYPDDMVPADKAFTTVDEVVSDADGVDISAQYGTEPDAAIPSHFYISDDSSVIC